MKYEDLERMHMPYGAPIEIEFEDCTLSPNRIKYLCYLRGIERSMMAILEGHLVSDTPHQIPGRFTCTLVDRICSVTILARKSKR